MEIRLVKLENYINLILVVVNLNCFIRTDKFVKIKLIYYKVLK